MTETARRGPTIVRVETLRVGGTSFDAAAFRQLLADQTGLAGRAPDRDALADAIRAAAAASTRGTGQ